MLIRIMLVFIIVIVVQTMNSRNLVINELMADNNSTLQDLDGDYSDWIEIYNDGDEEINLLNFQISDDSTWLNKWVFPEIIIAGYDFIILFASGKNIVTPSELHCNFKLKRAGETLYLSNPSGEVISSVTYQLMSSDNSYTALEDGNISFIVVDNPTPHFTNALSNGVYCSELPGYHSEDLEVSLIATNPDVEIYYTLDGSVPTLNSNHYSSPIDLTYDFTNTYNISSIPTTPLEGQYPLANFVWKEPEQVNMAKVLRYSSFEGQSQASKIYSKTFFIDPFMLNKYTFPIISLITDSLNLFDYEDGIFIPGQTFDDFGWLWTPAGNYSRRGVAWERDVHVNYHNSAGVLQFETEAGLRIHGQGSSAMPQKGLGLYFRSDYGLSNIDYPIFGNENNTKYKRLMLRNSGNDFQRTHFRDAFLQEIISSFDLELQANEPAVVFVNGEYWGIHNIREKIDKHYFKYKYGVSEEDLNLLEYCGEVIQGSNEDYVALTTFVAENDMTEEDSYSLVKDRLDVENFIDYYIAEIFFANADWPCNNSKIWKSNEPSAKWRMILYDLDFAAAFIPESYFDVPSLTRALTFGVDDSSHCECANFLFRQLMLNQVFQQQFIDRFFYHLDNSFDPDRIRALLNDYVAVYKVEIQEHIVRWGYPETINLWYDHIDIMAQFFIDRPCFMESHINDYFNLPPGEKYCSGERIEEIPGITIYPNPVTGGSVIIEGSNFAWLLTSYKLFSADGQVVMTGDMNSKSVRLDLSSLADGLYIVKVLSNNNTLVGKIFISQ